MCQKNKKLTILFVFLNYYYRGLLVNTKELVEFKSRRHLKAYLIPLAIIVSFCLYPLG